MYTLYIYVPHLRHCMLFRYKKNYKLEKAEAVLLRCTRHAEERSGAWLVKYLNHMSQVRMKQSRDSEASRLVTHSLLLINIHHIIHIILYCITIYYITYYIILYVI